MENPQSVVLEEKVGLFGMLKEAIKIPFKNPVFIIFTFITSLPMFYSLFIYETIFLQTMIEAARVLQEQFDHPDCLFCFSWQPLDAVDRLIGKVSHNFLLLVISHLGILHFLDLVNTIATVNSASSIYAGEEKALTLKEMFVKHLMDSRFKEPLVTSVCVLLLTSLLSMGLFSIAVYVYITHVSPLFTMIFVAMFVALLIQYVKWSAIWNLGTLISILEGKVGDEALLVSSYISRGNRRTGSLLMLVSLVWRLCLRVVLVYIFIVWNGRGRESLIILVHISLICMENVLKWVTFVVYFNHCRRLIRTEKVVVSQSV